MAGRAESGAQSDDRASLVRLGHLCFDDFLLLGPQALDFGLRTSDLASDWSFALNNAPHVEFHFRSADCGLQPANCKLTADAASLADVLAAQHRLVTHFAYDLLKAKAPPLYDALPWQDWDFSSVAKRFRLWQTRFLLAGDGTTVTLCRCRKSAGVYVFEPCEAIARYIERKAALERIRRFRLFSPKPQAASRKPAFVVPLPDNSVDLAVIGSCAYQATDGWELVVRELLRVAANVLLIENNPLTPPLPDTPLAAAGFKPDSVAVSGLGPRRCWWKQA